MTSESNCKYVSSVGIRKSCTVTSLDDSRWLIGFNFQDLKDCCVLYVKIDKIPEFMTKVLPLLKQRVVLVSGCGDYSLPNDLVSVENFIHWIENPYILHCYIQNCVLKHPKVSLLPIGLDYHTMSNYEMEWGPRTNPVDQEKQMEELRLQSKPFWERKIKCYSNFHFQTWTKFGSSRIQAMEEIPKDLIDYEPSKVQRIVTHRNQIEYAFVPSPHGNGLDCHRTWEALILGCIPIVKKSILDPLYENLPVLIVDQWSDINQSLLTKTVEEFKHKTFDLEKLTLKYWVNQFESHLHIV